MTCDCPKRGVIGRRKGIFRHSFGKSKRSCRYFVIKNHFFCFGYTTYFICCFLFHFQQNIEFYCSFDSFFSKIDKYNFYSGFYV